MLKTNTDQIHTVHRPVRSTPEPNGFTHTSPGQDRPRGRRPGLGIKKHLAG